jgi:hypothetical protein
MKIVKTVGQAFEVSHKQTMTRENDKDDDQSELISDVENDYLPNLRDFDESVNGKTPSQLDLK